MDHLWWIYPLKIVIFHSYVGLPEGTSWDFSRKHIKNQEMWRCFMEMCWMMFTRERLTFSKGALGRQKPHFTSLSSLFHASISNKSMLSRICSRNSWQNWMASDVRWNPGGLEPWNFIFHYIYGMSSFPLTNSIIFQRGRAKNHQPDGYYIMVILVIHGGFHGHYWSS